MDISNNPLPPALQNSEAGLTAEIAGEVRDMAIALFNGRLCSTLFQKAVITMESAKVQRFGLRLRTERLNCGSSRLQLSEAETGRPRATFDFVSASEDLERRQPHG